MSRIREQLLSIATEIGVSVIPVPLTEAELLIRRIRDNFTRGSEHEPLWERITDDYGVQNADAWQWLADFIGNSPCYLFLEPRPETNMVAFPTGYSVVRVLEEMFGIEFYVTGPNVDYLLCFNHHDYLISAGRSIPWLKMRSTT